MTIPSAIRIGSADYKVTVSSEVILSSDHHQCYGCIDFDKHEIKLADNVGDIQQQERTFLHEVFHAMLHDRGLEVTEEEKLVDGLAMCMRQIIRDNQELFLEKKEEKKNDE